MTGENILKIFKNIPTLKTPRLTLRKIRSSDANDMYEYSKNEEVTSFLLWRPHADIEFTKAYIEYLFDEYSKGNFYDWAIVVRCGEHKNKMIGTVGFTSFDLSQQTAEIGYVLNPDFWGNEVAAEALREIIYFGFTKLKLHRIEAKYIVGNKRSVRVMEKCNMQFEGIARSSMYIKDGWKDIGIYSIISDDFIDNLNYYENRSKIEYRELI